MLALETFDIILLDYNLPSEDGLTFLRGLGENHAVDTPIVVVTGHGHQELAVETMKAGAFDYVVKSGNYPEILPNVIKRVREKFQIVREKRRMEAEIRMRNQELQVLNSISQVLNRSLIIDEIVRDTVEVISESLRLPTAGIYLSGSSKTALRLAAGCGALAEADEPAELDPKVNEMGRLCATGTNGGHLLATEPNASWNEHLFAAGMRVCLAVPLVHNRHCVGLFVGASRDPHYFTERRINLFASICSQLTIAIENANLYLETSNLKDDLKNVLDSSLDLIVTLDRSGHILFFNQQFGRLQKEATRAGISGSRFLDFVPEHHHEKVGAKINGSASESSIYTTEIRTQTRSTIQCLVSQSRLKGRDDLLLVIKDISGIVRLQDELIRSEKLSALGQMIAGAAHELNNPLAGIIGYAQLLLEEELASGTRRDIEVMLKEARRCQKIVQHLLTFARQRSARQQPVDVNELIRLIARLVGAELYQDGIQLQTDLSPNLPHLAADQEQLQQALLHLIYNARDALRDSQRPHKVVTVRSENVDDAVRISVADNGNGIPKELCKHIFDPFFTTKDVGKGTGLGLSMCHAIVKAHQGKVAVSSEPGMGASFTVELPAKCHYDEVKRSEMMWGRYAVFDA